MTDIYFVKVADNKAKLNCICNTVQGQFDKGNRVLITVPNNEAAQYIDVLLWRQPEESFLPHTIASGQTREAVVITTDPKNHNKADVLLNLCAGCSPIAGEFASIYELHDESAPGKAELSQQRAAAYQSQGYAVHLPILL